MMGTDMKTDPIFIMKTYTQNVCTFFQAWRANIMCCLSVYVCQYDIVGQQENLVYLRDIIVAGTIL